MFGQVIGTILIIFGVSFLIGTAISIFTGLRNRKRAAAESGENKTEEKKDER